jgi:hypothetical protein
MGQRESQEPGKHLTAGVVRRQRDTGGRRDRCREQPGGGTRCRAAALDFGDTISTDRGIK